MSGSVLPKRSIPNNKYECLMRKVGFVGSGPTHPILNLAGISGHAAVVIRQDISCIRSVRCTRVYYTVFFLNPNSGVPLYVQLQHQLQQRILSGQLQHGAQLPSVASFPPSSTSTSSLSARFTRFLNEKVSSKRSAALALTFAINLLGSELMRAVYKSALR